jgi:hypothetical protein
MSSYACIKNNIVVNLLVFEDNDFDLRELVKTEHEYDEIVNTENSIVNLGDSYLNSTFISSIQPTEEVTIEEEPGIEVEALPKV